MPARVYKTLGAGDSFYGTFIAKLINGHPIDEALEYVAAAASITISGKSCSDSMPDLVLLDSYMQAWISGRIESWDGWEINPKKENKFNMLTTFSGVGKTTRITEFLEMTGKQLWLPSITV